MSINAALMRKRTILPLDTGSYSRLIRNGRVKTGEVAQAELAAARFAGTCDLQVMSLPVRTV
jgi:hypothetical protein